MKADKGTGQKVTIKDVARMAGVSLSTVSRILNKSKPVNDDVRDRVLEVIKATGFKPNAVARSMILKKTKVIGVLITDISNRYYGELVRGIENASAVSGYSIMLFDSNFDSSLEMKYLELMHEKMVDGVIVYTRSSLADFGGFFERTGMPVIFSNISPGSGHSITLDNYAMSYKAVEYLVRCGHRSIACIHTTQDDEGSGRDRFSGYKDALRDATIKFDDKLVQTGDYSMNSGYNCTQNIVAAKVPFSAMFVVSDEMAIGAMASLADNGLRIPDDVSIIGFDDIDYAKFCRPKLTTVHQPIYKTGTIACNLLLKLIRGEHVQACTTVEAELIIRDSVKMLR